MSDGIRVASLDDIDEGEGLRIDKSVTGTEDHVAILRGENGFCYALNDTCSHEPASLAEGFVEDGYVECPIHASRFNLKTGAVEGLPATKPVTAHRVAVREGEVYLYPGEAPTAP